MKLNPRKIKEIFKNRVRHAAFWKLNSHLFYPADGLSKELEAMLADLDL